MNRAIKFRGKRVDNGEWVYGAYFIVEDEEHFILDNCRTLHFTAGDSVFTGFPVAGFSVGQFTGLKDKDGKEIYEGDIVEVIPINGFRKPDKTTAVVIWNDDFATFAHSNDKCFDWVRYDGKFIIVGNIHDNPELLK